MWPCVTTASLATSTLPDGVRLILQLLGGLSQQGQGRRIVPTRKGFGGAKLERRFDPRGNGLRRFDGHVVQVDHAEQDLLVVEPHRLALLPVVARRFLARSRQPASFPLKNAGSTALRSMANADALLGRASG